MFCRMSGDSESKVGMELRIPFKSEASFLSDTSFSLVSVIGSESNLSLSLMQTFTTLEAVLIFRF